MTGPQYATGSKQEALAPVADRLPAILKFQGKNRYLCTKEKPTWVDFYFLELVNVLRWIAEGQIFSDYPALKIYYDDMCSLPKLKEHLADPRAPEKKLVFNGGPAKLNGVQNW